MPELRGLINISFPEQKTALALGEIKKGQVTRKDHKGTQYLTSGPTTRNSVAEDKLKQQLEDKKKLEKQQNQKQQ